MAETNNGIIFPENVLADYNKENNGRYETLMGQIGEGLLSLSSAKAIKTSRKFSALSLLYEYHLISSIMDNGVPKSSEEVYELLEKHKDTLSQTVKNIIYKVIVNELNKDLGPERIDIGPQDNPSMQHYNAVISLALASYGFNMRDLHKIVAHDPAKALEVFKEEAEQAPLRAGYQFASNLLDYSIPEKKYRLEVLSRTVGEEITDEQEGINKLAQKIRAELMSATDKTVALKTFRERAEKTPIVKLADGKTLEDLLREHGIAA